MSRAPETPAWCLGLSDLFFFFFLMGEYEIILTEFALNWSHMLGVSFQRRIEIRQATLY